jgi:hypothetical protein
MVTGCGANTVQALLDGECLMARRGSMRSRRCHVHGLPGCYQKRDPTRAANSLPSSPALVLAPAACSLTGTKAEKTQCGYPYTLKGRLDDACKPAEQMSKALADALPIFIQNMTEVRRGVVDSAMGAAGAAKNTC